MYVNREPTKAYACDDKRFFAGEGLEEQNGTVCSEGTKKVAANKKCSANYKRKIKLFFMIYSTVRYSRRGALTVSYTRGF